MKLNRMVLTALLATMLVPGAGMCGWGIDVDITSDPVNDQKYPAMAIAENGVVFVAMEDDGIGTDTAISIYKSIAGGSTWEYVATMEEPGSDLVMPDLAIGEILGGFENYLFVAAVVHDGADSYIRIGRYDMMNRYWLDFTDLTHSGEESRPRIVTDYRYYEYDWYVYLAYQIDRDADTNHDVYYRRSTDMGETWSTTSPIFGLNDEGRFENPEVAFGRDELYIVCQNTDENSILVRRSDDSGATFKAAQTISSGSEELSMPAVAAGPGGTAVVVYNRAYSVTDTDVFYSYTMDGGLNWAGENYIPGAYTSSDELAPVIAASWLPGGDYHVAWTLEGDVIHTTATVEYPDTWMSTSYVNDSPNASGEYIGKAIDVHRFDASAIAWVDYRDNDIFFDGDYDNVPEVSVDAVIHYPYIIRPGWLTYTPRATNHMQSPKTVYFWNRVELPDGTMYPSSGYLFDYGPFTLDGYESLTAPRPLDIFVPGVAPLGDYKLYSYVGTELGGEPIDVSIELFEIAD